MKLNVTLNENDFCITCDEGFYIFLQEAFNIIDNFSKKKDKSEIILKLYAAATAASVIEPAKAEKNLSDEISPYWFSVKTIISSVLGTGVQLLLAAVLSVFRIEKRLSER